MPCYRFATSVQIDTLLPRDVMMINPTFNTINPAADLDALATDWANAVGTFISPSGSPYITVKVFDVRQHPHGPPLAMKTKNAPSATFDSSYPREMALCLSFFAGQNVKRRRGRLYVPLTWIQASVGTLGTRPTVAARDAVASLVPKLTGLGGIDIDWCVYSKVDDQARSVSDWFVDDEWDTQRPRGRRSTTRTAGTVSE